MHFQHAHAGTPPAQTDVKQDIFKILSFRKACGKEAGAVIWLLQRESSDF